jgi:hypothetical protein
MSADALLVVEDEVASALVDSACAADAVEVLVTRISLEDAVLGVEICKICFGKNLRTKQNQGR